MSNRESVGQSNMDQAVYLFLVRDLEAEKTDFELRLVENDMVALQVIFNIDRIRLIDAFLIDPNKRYVVDNSEADRLNQKVGRTFRIPRRAVFFDFDRW
jgi:hypothetical protein